MIIDRSEPSYETYLEQTQKVQGLKTSIHDIRVYQTDVLGTLREKMEHLKNASA